MTGSTAVGNNAWCILRTAGRNTLPLARSLTQAGLEAWTPIEVQRRRNSRTKAIVERDVPLMPTFVFSRARNVTDLILLAASLVKPQPDFSVFHYLGRIPLLADREIQPLRIAERRVAPKQRHRVYRKGEMVRVPEGPFTGLSGIVEESDGRFVLVCFGGRVRVKIATFLLGEPEAQSGQSTARAA